MSREMILTLFSVGTPKACLFYREDRWKQMRRIVVTGMGAVSPLGANVDISWSRLLAGQSGIRQLTDDVVGDLPAKVGGVVPSLAEDAEGGFDPDRIIAPKDQRKVDRFIIFALAAAEEALVQANWKPVSNEDRLRTATIIASGIGGFPAITEAVRTVDQRGVRRLSPFTIPSFLVNLAAGQVSIRHGFKGPLGAPVTACAAGVQRSATLHGLFGPMKPTLRFAVERKLA